MEIHGTKKLLDTIPFLAVLDSVEYVNPIFSWHANLVMVNRRKTLILMNDHNRYVVVLYALTVKELKELDELIIDGIRQALKAERVPIKIINSYIAKAGKITFHKNKKRSLVSNLKLACESVWSIDKEVDVTQQLQLEIGKKVSRMLVGGKKVPKIYPYKEMRHNLMEMGSSDSVNTKVAVMHISYTVQSHSIWRRVLVPLDFTFTDLHQIIQKLFGCDNAHLYSFQLYKESPSESNARGLHIAMAEEVESNPELENNNAIDFLLAGFIPPYSHIKYLCNLGANFDPIIVVEEILEYDKRISPICVDGAGGSSAFLEAKDESAHSFNRATVNAELELI